MMKGNISVAITVVLVLSILFSPYPSSDIQSRTIASTNWNGPGGNGEHNGYFPSFVYNPPLSLKWEKKIIETFSDPPLNIALNANKIVFATNNDTINIFNKNDGSKIKQIKIDPFGKNYAVINGSTAIAGNKKGISAYSLETGIKKWESPSYEANLIMDVIPFPVLNDDKILTNFGNNLIYFAVSDSENNADRIQMPFDVKDKIIEMPTNSKEDIVVSYDSIFYMKDFIYDKTIMKVTGIDTYPAGPACINNGNIFYASNKVLRRKPFEKAGGEGSLISVDTKHDEVNWLNRFYNFAVLATPSSDGSRVFASCSDGYLRTFDAYTGKTLWEFKTNGPIHCQSIVTDEYIYIASTDSYLYGLKIDTGEQSWKFKLSAPVVSSTIAMDSQNLYVLCKDGNLYCFGENNDTTPHKIVLGTNTNKVRIDKSANLKVAVYNESNVEISNKHPNLKIEPSDFGTIKDGVFYPKRVGECKIIASLNSISSELAISVFNKPPIFEEYIEIVEISEDEIVRKKIPFKNETNFPVSIDLSMTKPLGIINTMKFTIAPKDTFDVEYSIEGSKLKSEGINNFTIEVVSEGVEKYFIKVALKKIELKKPVVENLLIENVDPQGKKKKCQMKFINLNEKSELKITLSSVISWISIENKIFNIEPKSEYICEIVIDQKQFNFSEEKRGEINVQWHKGYFKIEVIAKSIPDTIPPTLNIKEINPFRDAKTGFVSGSVEAGAKLYYQIEDQERAKIITKNGEFTLEVKLLPSPSITKVALFAIDPFGNETKKEVEIINLKSLKVIMQIGNPIMTVGDKNVPISPAPMVYKGATIIPLRALSEAFGAKVEFANGEITVTLREKVVKLKIGSNIASINGTNMPVNPAPVIIQGKTMVPFRFIAEALGAQVFWDQSSKTITMQTEVWPSN